jgi:hypothetical protein
MRRGGSGRGSRMVLAGAVAVALAAPSGALAAGKPVVRTGGVSNVGQSDALLNGSVNPNGGATTYFFQFGTNSLYGAQTPDASAGARSKAVKVTSGLTGLAPATTYHYRLVARKGNAIVKGADRTFKTKRQPLGVSLAASPNPVRTGNGTLLGGQLTGTGNAGRQVVLQYNPFPYTQGFVNATNAQVTDAQGNFGFPVLSVPVNSEFRVLMPQKPEVVSPIVAVGTVLRVTTRVKVRRGVRRGSVRLTGTIEPAADGTQVLIQKFVGNRWANIASTFARHSTDSASRYRKTVRQRRGGRYRVLVNAQGAHSPSYGTPKRVRRVRS